MWADLAEQFGTEARAHPGLVVGLCGPQGSGKSTGAAIMAEALRVQGLRSAVLSLDDLYLTRAERARLAAEVHPLAAVRGPPGTHDVDLGLALLDALGRAGPVRQPRFDKAADDRAPESAWPVAQGPADIVLFEGWCVGAKPQPDAALGAPINVLETQEDPHGVWRRWVNAQLAGPYRPLFARLARLILLRAPSFPVVRRWRGEAEAERRAQTGGGMSAAEIDRFVQVYERLSGHIAEEMAGRADVVITLDANRNPIIQ